jgi:hypothetical protein
MSNILVWFDSGGCAEHLKVMEQDAAELESAFANNADGVYTLHDKDGKTLFRMKNVVAIAINKEEYEGDDDIASQIL